MKQTVLGKSVLNKYSYKQHFSQHFKECHDKTGFGESQ